MKKKYQVLILIFFFFVAFFVSFYRATDIQHSEDFKSSIATVKFVKDFSVNAISTDGINAMEFFALPFYLIFGFTYFSLRLAQSFFLSLAVVLFYIFCLKHFQDKRKAILSTILLVFFPYFILMKYAEYPFIAFYAIFLLNLFFWTIKKKENTLPLLLLGFFIGLGTYYKILIGAYSFLLLFSYLLLNFKDFREKFLTIKKVILLSVTVLIGLLPLIVWNINNYYITIGEIFHGEGAFSLLNILSVFQYRIFSIYEIFTSSAIRYFGEIWAVGMLLFVLFVTSVLYLLFKRDKKNIYFVLVLLFFLLISSIEMNDIVLKHLYIIVPLFFIIITAGLSHVIKDFLSVLTKDKKRAKMLSDKVFSFLIFMFLVAGLINIYTIFSTDNNYDTYLSRYEIGQMLEDDSIDNIYIFEPRNYKFFDIVPFTAKKTVIYAYDITMGEDFVVYGHPDGNEVSYCQGGRRVNKKLEDLLQEAVGKNNVYLDTLLPYDNEREGIERVNNREKIDEFLFNNGYLKIEINSSGHGKNHIVWVSEDNHNLIDKIKEVRERMMVFKRGF